LETAVKKLYEAMFLVDSAKAAADWEGINKVIRGLLEKADAEIVSIKKWDERKLAYDIQGKSRGTYILCYFRAGGEKIALIERAVQLSEQVMRVLILCADHLTQEDIDKATPLMRATEPAPKDEGESKTKEKPESKEKPAGDEAAAKEAKVEVPVEPEAAAKESKAEVPVEPEAEPDVADIVDELKAEAALFSDETVPTEAATAETTEAAEAAEAEKKAEAAEAEEQAEEEKPLAEENQ